MGKAVAAIWEMLQWSNTSQFYQPRSAGISISLNVYSTGAKVLLVLLKLPYSQVSGQMMPHATTRQKRKMLFVRKLWDINKKESQFGPVVETWHSVTSSSTYQDCPADSGRDAKRSRSLVLSRYNCILTHKQEETEVITHNRVTQLKYRHIVNFLQ